MKTDSQKKVILSIFYYLTPFFILIDYFFDFNIRITGLNQFGIYKNIYYLFCLSCAVIIYKYEGYSLVVGFVESLINLLILFIGFLLPYFRYASLIADGNIEEVYFYDTKIIINFMISGFIVILSFQYSLNRIGNRFAL
jgi:hypothetical protein